MKYAALLKRHGGNPLDLDTGYNPVCRDHRIVLVPEGQSLDMAPGTGPVRPWLNQHLGSEWHLSGFLEISE